MRVALTGGTGVIGRAAVATLAAGGHDVVVLARTPKSAAQAEALGARTVVGGVMNAGLLEGVFGGADAVISLATHVPSGHRALLPGAWRRDDRLRTTGVARVVDAARQCGVRRVVQASASFLYADHGDSWITENSPVAITPMTEPTAVAESLVQEYCCESRTGVVLRFGAIVGDDPQSAHLVRQARAGRPIGIGLPSGWAHVVHTDDLGSAVLAALHAPAGVYNVGAAPVLRRELAAGYAAAADVDSASFRGPVSRWLLGSRLEPLARSHRVCSDTFSAQTGWSPTRPVFDEAWLNPARAAIDAPA